MKATELMLGDWVLDTEFGRNKQDQIERLGHVWVLLKNGLFTPINYIEPIPLTAEILEKNGFGYVEHDDYLSHYYLGEGWYLDNPDLHIGTYNKGVYWLNYLDNAMHGIKYVHELQHALKLCGIEKEIKL